MWTNLRVHAPSIALSLSLAGSHGSLSFYSTLERRRDRVPRVHESIHAHGEAFLLATIERRARLVNALLEALLCQTMDEVLRLLLSRLSADPLHHGALLLAGEIRRRRIHVADVIVTAVTHAPDSCETCGRFETMQVVVLTICRF